MLMFLFEAAVFWFILVFVSQEHRTNLWDVTIKLFIYYIISSLVGSFVSYYIPIAWLSFLVYLIIVLAGLGFMLYRHFVFEFRKIALVLGIFFGFRILVSLGLSAYSQWLSGKILG